MFWWRNGNDEVDFVVANDEDVWAIEVKSERVRPTGGMTKLLLRYPNTKTLVVGFPQCSLEAFFTQGIDFFER